MSKKDTTDTTVDGKYYIKVKDRGVVDFDRPFLGMSRNQFSCQMCGTSVTVSEKKAKKLRKMKKPRVMCKTCKKVAKARRRR